MRVFFPQALITEENINGAMQKVDKNKDGEINYRQFAPLLLLLVKPLYRQKMGKGEKRGKGKGKRKDDE